VARWSIRPGNLRPARQPRPLLNSAPARLDYGQPFQLHISQTTAIHEVALVHMDPASPAVDGDPRYVSLRFTHGDGDWLDVVAPPDHRIAPLGQYLLFILDEHGVPSEGRFVHLDTARA
jgi:hypothetical protein